MLEFIQKKGKMGGIFARFSQSPYMLFGAVGLKFL
jgi:hypothetical protein